MATGRDRSNQIRGAHADEVTKRGLTADDVQAAITAATTTPVVTTLNGVPTCTNPFVIGSRVDASTGLVFPTMRFGNVSSNCRRFWPTIRKIKRNGLYGPPLVNRIRVGPEHIAAGGFVEHEWEKGLPPNFTFHVVLIEAKLTGFVNEDGGNRDQFPNPYTPVTVPSGTSFLANGIILTGDAQSGPEAENECLNSKFKYSRATWEADPDDPSGSATELAKWRFGTGLGFGGNNADPIVAASVSTARNHWCKVGYFFSSGFVNAGTLVLHRGGQFPSSEDVCARLQGRPFDPGEPFNVQMSRALKRNLAFTDQPANLIATLEDSNAGVIATTTYAGINLPQNGPWPWEQIRFPETFVSTSYIPSGNSKQWVRLRLSASQSFTRVTLDKVSFSHMAGSYKPHPRDRQQLADSDITDTQGGGRGPSGYGITGNESPSTGQGQLIRIPTD